MPSQRILFGAGLCILAGLASAQGTTLEEKENEWFFTFSRVDRDDFGEELDLDLNWAWVFQGGYHQVGVATDYFDIDFDDPLLLDVDGYAIGPLYKLNFSPKNDRFTGFAFASYRKVGGDLGDVFDSTYSIGAGLEGFLGDSASVVAFYSLDEFQGATGFSDEDQTTLQVGIAIYSGNRWIEPQRGEQITPTEPRRIPAGATATETKPSEPEASGFTPEQIDAIVYQSLGKAFRWQSPEHILLGLPITAKELDECLSRLVKKGVVDVRNFASGPKYRLPRR